MTGTPPRWLVARAAVGLVALSALLLAWRSGGGAEAPEPPPRAAAEAGGATTPATSAAGRASPAPAGPDGLVESARLVDLVNDARIDAPTAREVARALPFHWRKLKPPFVSARPELASFVSSVALRTSGPETQAAVNAGGAELAFRHSDAIASEPTAETVPSSERSALPNA